jgi:hypothetical protein
MLFGTMAQAEMLKSFIDGAGWQPKPTTSRAAEV